ncbi:MAG: hypothetical protein JO240_05490 [Solirubrobacterales bacterium]|nr:hypothetical protein [Solirubrobacterales bacterium]
MTSPPYLLDGFRLILGTADLAPPTLCKRGHPRTPENLTARRECLTCRRARQRERYRERYRDDTAFRERERVHSRRVGPHGESCGCMVCLYFSDDSARHWKARSIHIERGLRQTRKRIEAKPPLPRVSLGEMIDRAIKAELGSVGALAERAPENIARRND